jgi:magnesium transporter
MTKTHTFNGIVWLDHLSPTNEEITTIVKRYELHPLVGEELKNSTALAKVDFYEDYIFIILTLPVRVHQDGVYTIVDREIDFVIGKNFLITARDTAIEQIEYFSKIFDTNSILNKDEKKIEHPGHLFYYIIKKIYAGMCEDLENIKDTLVGAETKIFSGDERKMVEVLSNISRELIDFKQTVRMHRDIWEKMVDHDENNIFGNEFNSYVQDVRDEFNSIHELISNARELLNDIRETNNSLLNSKQNDIIKVLTLAAFIFYPLMLMAAIFTIPAINVPLIGSSYGWITVISIMVILAAGIWWFFKKKKWL